MGESQGAITRVRVRGQKQTTVSTSQGNFARETKGTERGRHGTRKAREKNRKARNEEGTPRGQKGMRGAGKGKRSKKR